MENYLREIEAERTKEGSRKGIKRHFLARYHNRGNNATIEERRSKKIETRRKRSLSKKDREREEEETAIEKMNF